MTKVVAPIHAANIGKGELRFFRSPSTAPDLPWHAFEDLAKCLGLPRSLRREFHRKLVSGPFKDDARTIATTTGIVTIAPHFCAQGLIQAAVHFGAAEASIEMEYVRAGVAAMNVLTGDLPPQASFEYVIAAARNHVGGGET